MPWTAADAARKTKKAKSAAAQRQWVTVANAELKRTGDDGRAIRVANAAVARRAVRKPKSK